jgi:hypothetical protein
LGCNPEYEVLITFRGNGPALGSFEPESVTWGRSMDDYSEARIQFPGQCCGKLAEVRSWAHEIHLLRDGEEVWVGPVLVDASCRSGGTLIARDMWWWLNRRVIHADHVSTSQGAVSIAQDLIIDGFAPDDPQVLQYLTTYGTGILGGRDYQANSKYVLDALKDLAKGSIDFTAIGRRLLVMPQGYKLGQLPILTCDSFQGDVCATDDGTGAATRAVFTNSQTSSGGDITVLGESGGVDPYFGLVEVLVTDSTITDAQTATDAARATVAKGNPPPLLVQPPDNSALSGDVPICINDLIPGVTVPVLMDCTCRTVSQDMRLSKLSVSWDENGETVGPLLVPVGSDVEQ